ncbi:hypothetical protein Sent03_02562 [Salmonella enterica]
MLQCILVSGKLSHHRFRTLSGGNIQSCRHIAHRLISVSINKPHALTNCFNLVWISGCKLTQGISVTCRISLTESFLKVRNPLSSLILLYCLTNCTKTLSKLNSNVWTLAEVVTG